MPVYGASEHIVLFIHRELRTVEDKKGTLREAARRVFSERGYRATSIAAIAKEAHVAVGSFYNYYRSKEEAFIDVHDEENDRVRRQMMDEIDWTAEPVKVAGQLFDCSLRLVASNKILSEWDNPAIASTLHAHYWSDAKRESYPFHQFLTQTFSQRMTEAGFDEERIRQVQQVYELIYFMDTHITSQDFPGFEQAIRTLVTYFVKGIFT